MLRRRLLPTAVLFLMIATAGLLPASGRAATTCPGFDVLHDDAVGGLRLPAGSYTLAATRLSCNSASGLFTAFLDDWDGVLPRPWRTTAQGSGRGTFTGAGGQRIVVRRVGRPSGGGGGRHPASGLVCAQRFTLSQPDRIGALKLKKGRYFIDRLSARAPTCTQAAVLLGRFLGDFDGILPGGWVVLPEDGTFVRGATSYGFRLEPDPTHGGGGGTRFPTKTSRCPATFTVLHADHVRALKFPAGPYWVSILKGSDITCPQSTQLFASFLARTDGRLPKPWVIDVASGSFTRGRGSRSGFVTKPAFRVR